MVQIRLSDCTLKHDEKNLPLSFREKIELCKLIDRLEIDQIELQMIRKPKADHLLIKSIASAVQHAAVAVPVPLSPEEVEKTWNAVREAKKPVLQVEVPTSSVQMEYLLHLKPAALKARMEATIQACRQLTDRVEMIAQDATRADPAFLREMITAALQSGATSITVCDSASSMLPENIASFISGLIRDIPALKEKALGFSGSNQLHLADACAVSAIESGAVEIKTEAFRREGISLLHLSRILQTKGSEFGVFAQMNHQQAGRITSQIEQLCKMVGSRVSDGRDAETHEPMLSAHDSREAVLKSAQNLGYDLSEEDAEKVWNAFCQIAERKEYLSLHELDAIIATEAMQVPQAYTDVNYVINTGNAVGAMAHMKLRFHGQELEGISTGDGVIDAAFLAIEKAIGRHFELDDFQIQAIAEGREAMGETLVKLRSDGKLFSGRGISTDIVGSSVMAYISALNKIVFEEEDS